MSWNILPTFRLKITQYSMEDTGIHGDFPTELFKKMDKNGVQLLRSPCSGGKLRKHPAVLEELHVEILTCDFIAVGKKSVRDSQAGGFLFLVAQLYNGNQSGNQI